MDKKFTFENSGANTYLVYEIGAEDCVDSMSMGMITNNKIPGLSQAIFMQMNDKKYLKYNISARISVSQFFAGTVNKRRLLGVFNGIADAMLACEDYMLDMGSIVLDLNYMYTDVSSCETSLICLPIVDTETQPRDMKAFFRNIIFSTQFDQTENCDYVARIINYLNSTAMFSFAEFKNVLEDITANNQPGVTPVQYQQQQQQIPVPPVATPAMQAAPVATAPATAQAPMTAQQAMPVNNIPQGMPVQQNAPVQQPPVTPPPVAQAPVQQKTPTPAVAPVPPANQPNTPGNAPAGDDKGMSWMYLMQHYNKENAALYKEQKANKKNKNKASAPVQQPPVAQAPIPQAQVPPKAAAVPTPPPMAAPAGNFGFAVPGQAPVPQANQQVVPPTPQQPAKLSKAEAKAAAKAAKSAAAPVPQQPIQQKAPVPAAAPIQQAPVNQPVNVPNMPAQGHAMNFGETMVLGGGASVPDTTITTPSSTLVTPVPISASPSFVAIG